MKTPLPVSLHLLLLSLSPAFVGSPCPADIFTTASSSQPHAGSLESVSYCRRTADGVDDGLSFRKGELLIDIRTSAECSTRTDAAWVSGQCREGGTVSSLTADEASCTGGDKVWEKAHLCVSEHDIPVRAVNGTEIHTICSSSGTTKVCADWALFWGSIPPPISTSFPARLEGNAATATTLVLPETAESIDNFYKGWVVVFEGPTTAANSADDWIFATKLADGRGQWAEITNYVGSTKVATFGASHHTVAVSTATPYRLGSAGCFSERSHLGTAGAAIAGDSLCWYTDLQVASRLCGGSFAAGGVAGAAAAGWEDCSSLYATTIDRKNVGGGRVDVWFARAGISPQDLSPAATTAVQTSVQFTATLGASHLTRLRVSDGFHFGSFAGKATNTTQALAASGDGATTYGCLSTAADVAAAHNAASLGQCYWESLSAAQSNCLKWAACTAILQSAVSGTTYWWAAAAANAVGDLADAETTTTTYLKAALENSRGDIYVGHMEQQALGKQLCEDTRNTWSPPRCFACFERSTNEIAFDALSGEKFNTEDLCMRAAYEEKKAYELDPLRDTTTAVKQAQQTVKEYQEEGFELEDGWSVVEDNAEEEVDTDIDPRAGHVWREVFPGDATKDLPVPTGATESSEWNTFLCSVGFGGAIIPGICTNFYGHMLPRGGSQSASRSACLKTGNSWTSHLCRSPHGRIVQTAAIAAHDGNTTLAQSECEGTYTPQAFLKISTPSGYSTCDFPPRDNYWLGSTAVTCQPSDPQNDSVCVFQVGVERAHNSGGCRAAGFYCGTGGAAKLCERGYYCEQGARFPCSSGNQVCPDEGTSVPESCVGGSVPNELRSQCVCPMNTFGHLGTSTRGEQGSNGLITASSLDPRPKGKSISWMVRTVAAYDSLDPLQFAAEQYFDVIERFAYLRSSEYGPPQRGICSESGNIILETITASTVEQEDCGIFWDAELTCSLSQVCRVTCEKNQGCAGFNIAADEESCTLLSSGCTDPAGQEGSYFVRPGVDKDPEFLWSQEEYYIRRYNVSAIAEIDVRMLEGLETLDITCSPCPEGVVECSQGATYLELEAMPGFWQDKALYHNYPGKLHFLECTAYGGESCGGGVGLEGGWSNCTGHFEGKRCGKCNLGTTWGGYFFPERAVEADGKCATCFDPADPDAGRLAAALGGAAIAGCGLAIGLIFWFRERLKQWFGGTTEIGRIMEIQETLMNNKAFQLMDMSNKMSSVTTKLKCLLAFYQISISFTYSFPKVHWPHLMTFPLNFLKFIDLDPLAFPGLNCVLAPTPLRQFWWATTGPFFFVAVVYMAHFPCCGWITKKFYPLNPMESGVQKQELREAHELVLRAKDPNMSEKEIKERCDKYIYRYSKKRRGCGQLWSRSAVWKFTIFVLFATYPRTCATIVSIFQCEPMGPEDDRSYWLSIDLTVECSWDFKVLYWGWGIVCLLLFPLGVPLLFWYRLSQMREVLFDNNGPRDKQGRPTKPLASTKWQIGVLYANYEPEYYYFEIFEMINKFFLCAALMFISPGSPMQFIVGMVFTVVFLVLKAFTSPCVSDIDDFVFTVSQLFLFFLLLGGLISLLNAELQRSNNDILSDVKGSMGMPFNIIMGIVTLLPIPMCTFLQFFGAFSLFWKRYQVVRRTMGQLAPSFLAFTASQLPGARVCNRCLHPHQVNPEDVEFDEDIQKSHAEFSLLIDTHRTSNGVYVALENLRYQAHKLTIALYTPGFDWWQNERENPMRVSDWEKQLKGKKNLVKKMKSLNGAPLELSEREREKKELLPSRTVWSMENGWHHERPAGALSQTEFEFAKFEAPFKKFLQIVVKAASAYSDADHEFAANKHSTLRRSGIEKVKHQLQIFDALKWLQKMEDNFPRVKREREFALRREAANLTFHLDKYHPDLKIRGDEMFAQWRKDPERFFELMQEGEMDEGVGGVTKRASSFFERRRSKKLEKRKANLRRKASSFTAGLEKELANEQLAHNMVVANIIKVLNDMTSRVRGIRKHMMHDMRGWRDAVKVRTKLSSVGEDYRVSGEKMLREIFKKETEEDDKVRKKTKEALKMLLSNSSVSPGTSVVVKTAIASDTQAAIVFGFPNEVMETEEGGFKEVESSKAVADLPNVKPGAIFFIDDEKIVIGYEYEESKTPGTFVCLRRFEKSKANEKVEAGEPCRYKQDMKENRQVFLGEDFAYGDDKDISLVIPAELTKEQLRREGATLWLDGCGKMKIIVGEYDGNTKKYTIGEDLMAENFGYKREVIKAKGLRFLRGQPLILEREKISRIAVVDLGVTFFGKFLRSHHKRFGQKIYNNKSNKNRGRRWIQIQRTRAVTSWAAATATAGAIVGATAATATAGAIVGATGTSAASLPPQSSSATVALTTETKPESESDITKALRESRERKSKALSAAQKHWISGYSKSRAKKYWVNENTGEVSWDDPNAGETKKGDDPKAAEAWSQRQLYGVNELLDRRGKNNDVETEEVAETTMVVPFSNDSATAGPPGGKEDESVFL